MSTYLTHLKRGPQSKDNRWIVKYDGELVKEVKLIFNPKEYRKQLGSRNLFTKDKLIEILEYDKKKRAAK
tara:strand:+ start:15941 stop:16150 length:210 start_codon:yes stop_codon:yes gene_type:complete